MAPLARLFWFSWIFLCILFGHAFEDGDLRLVYGEETTYGVQKLDSATHSYQCSTNLFLLHPETRTQCTAADSKGHTTSPPESGQRFTSCPREWTKFGKACYRYQSNQTTWMNSRRACAKQGGDLARIPDAETNDFLISLLRGQAYILANFIRVKGTLEYLPNQPVKYTRWAYKEPTYSGGLEQCVGVHRNGEWFDVNCDIPKGFLCSKEINMYWLDNVECSGNEAKIQDCVHGAWGTSNCTESDAVKISCSYKTTKTDRGEEPGFHATTTYKGVLQVYHSRSWRYICDNNFDLRDSQVACRQLNKIPHFMHKVSGLTRGKRSVKEYNVGCAGGPTGGADCTQMQPDMFRCPGSPSFTICSQVKVCDRDRYGEDCSGICGHCTNDRCSSRDGICPPGGCEPGYRGLKCDQPCQNGYWGHQCKQRCGHCKATPCDAVSGKCDGGQCQDGYLGGRCDRPCQTGRWGKECLEKCGKCNESSCRHTDGVCLSGKCLDGYLGPKCNTACEGSSWGPNCKNKCGFCKGPKCDVTTGVCPSGVCDEGYTGEKCVQVCDQGWWGLNCTEKCGHCLNSTCEAKDGYCPSGVCEEGYEGERCDTIGSSIPACKKECPVCDTTTCDQTEDNPYLSRQSDTELPACELGAWVYPTLYVTSFMAVLTTAGVIVQWMYALKWGLLARKRKTIPVSHKEHENRETTGTSPQAPSKVTSGRSSKNKYKNTPSTAQTHD